MRTMSNLRFLSATIALTGVVSLSQAQFGGSGFFGDCLDPENTAPYSTNYVVSNIGNDFISAFIGRQGTVTMGKADAPPCWGTTRTLNAAGGFGFMVGPVGSRQTDFDDNMALTFGAPIDSVGDFCYAKIIRYDDPTVSADQKQKLFGEGGYRGFFIGASRRYWKAFYTDSNADIELTTSVYGDTVRMAWEMFNRNASAVKYLGLRFGAWVGMRSQAPDDFGRDTANVFVGSMTNLGHDFKDGFSTSPTGKPFKVEQAFISGRSNFPDYVNFNFGQSTPYGLRIENRNGNSTNDATPVDHFIVANYGFFQAPALLSDYQMTPRVFTDRGFGDPVLDANPDPIQEASDNLLSNTSFMQTFKPEPVGAGQSRTVVHYLRSTWSVADYRNPYAFLLDAPRLIASGADENGLTPNPFTVFAYLDNQYADVDREVPLTDVRFTISLEDGGGLKLEDGEPLTKLVSRIDPNEIGSVNWNLVADGTKFGNLTYKVKVQPGIGPARELTGTVLVASTPTVRLGEGPNLISFPWSFADTALDSILGLTAGVDYVAYRWQPELGEYIPVTSATRGSSTWIVPLSDQGQIVLNGATPPTDSATGGIVTTLQAGWNQIGNPYNYPVPISQLVGVASDSPASALTWTDLIDSGLVNGSLAYWVRNPEDPNSGRYEFTTGVSAILDPNVGYWVYVNAFNPIKITWPAVNVDGLPGSQRTGKDSTLWQQSDKQWRLQLAARNSEGMDSQNFVGIAPTAKAATQLTIVEPPAAINSKIGVSILEDYNGKPTRLAQSLANNAGRKEWKVLVKSDATGDVTVTWPNISTVPRNVNLQIVDKVTNTSRDLRFNGSYTFRMDEPGTRELTVQMQPGQAARAVIGDIVVSRPSRDPRAGFTINYALSASATTSIRILNGTGKEVYTVTRGRAEGAGQNTATWQMRDNANRAVAPGAYQVEIVAEVASGERIRKIVPVNVVR